jgi:hypothetical protein
MATKEFANKIRTSFKSGSVSNTNFRTAIKNNKLSQLIQEAASELKTLTVSGPTKGAPEVVQLLKVKVKNGVQVLSDLVNIYQGYLKAFVGQRASLSDFKKAVEKYEKKKGNVQASMQSNVPSDIFASASQFAEESLKVYKEGNTAIERAVRGGAKGYTEESAAAFNSAYGPAVAQAEATVAAAANKNANTQAAYNVAAANAAANAASANAAAAEAANAAANASNAPELTTLLNEKKPVNTTPNAPESTYPLLLTNRSPENAAAAKAANNAVKAAQNAANAAAVNAAKKAVAAQNANMNAARAAELAAANSKAQANVLARIAKGRAEARPPPGLPPWVKDPLLAKRSAFPLNPVTGTRTRGLSLPPGTLSAPVNALNSNNSSLFNTANTANTASVGSMNSYENNTELNQMNASRNNSGSGKNELNSLSSKITANLMRMTNTSVSLRNKANNIKERLSRLNKSIIASGKTLMGNERAAMMARVTAILRDLDGKVQALNSTTPGLREELEGIEGTVAQLEAQYPSVKQDGGKRANSRKQKQKQQKNRSTKRRTTRNK